MCVLEVQTQMIYDLRFTKLWPVLKLPGLDVRLPALLLNLGKDLLVFIYLLPLYLHSFLYLDLSAFKFGASVLEL